MSRVAWALLACVFFFGCPGEPPAPKSVAQLPPKTPVPEARADGRLPDGVAPTRYELAFAIDPKQPELRGSSRIDIVVAEKTSHVVLHGRDLVMVDARALVQGETIRGTWSFRTAHDKRAREELVLTFDKPLPPGPATLALAWRAPFSAPLTGVWRVEDGKKSYAFTQFEPTDARRAFPCFDEPTWKTPFEISITTPRGLVAFANSPETERRDGPDGTTFRFAPTSPLPTYLVAFAVGELDVVELPRSRPPNLRLIATKGKTGLGRLALEAASALVDIAADTFGIPYPYAKLDIVAVPDFGGAAMENAGLVTFGEEKLLLDPARASASSRRSQAIVIAHELAHQWFGNLVTASWWNDLWLNEGMATWAEFKLVGKWRPDMGLDVDAVATAHAVMDLDGLGSARAVRQPVVSTSEAEEAFDGITYDKGAAVLRTIERWIGEEAFLRGIKEYLTESAWKSVHAERLFLALDRASGKNVTQMAAGFLDKPGVPVVSVQLTCERGARWNAELSQEPWRPLGSKMPEEENRSWTIPVCVRAQGEKKNVCAALSMGAPSLVAGQGRCPTFLHPNVEGGYYRFALEEKEMVRLAEARAELDVAARISVLSNAWASVRAGKLEPRALLKVLPPFDDDGARQTAGLVVAILSGMNEALVEDDARAAFQKFVAARLAKRKKDLGWLPKKDEPADDALLRREILAALGDLAEDDATLRESEEHAKKWLADPSSLDADTAAVALDLASRRAGKDRLDELHRAVASAKSREDRLTALRATTGFDDAAVFTKALERALGDEVQPSDFRHVIVAAFARRKMRPIAETWVRASWDAVRKKLPGAIDSPLFRAVSASCSKDDLTEREAFYAPRIAEMGGTPRRVAEALEAATLCASLRASGAASLGRALLGQPLRRQ